jgi:acyl dehydratase
VGSKECDVKNYILKISTLLKLMKISSEYVGTPLKPYQKRVSWRDTMTYAAAIHDYNPLYFDDTREGGIIAPPMFTVAATWPILQNLPQYLSIEDFPHEILLTQVHYSEHLIFHRPIKPDETLMIQGKIKAMLPHRAGTHMVVRFDAIDQHKKPVFTEHTGAMMRGIQCRDDGKGSEVLPNIPARGNDHRFLWENKISIDPLLPFIYDGCSRIFFPIHISKKFARQVGLPDIILQGTATLALAVRELINREGKGNPFKLKEIYCRFTGMVFPGSEIKLKAYGSFPGENTGAIYFNVLNAEGKKAISKGYARLADLS